MVFLFTGQKYDKLDWIFMKRKNTHTHTHPQRTAVEHFPCGDQPALEDVTVSGHKTF